MNKMRNSFQSRIGFCLCLASLVCLFISGSCWVNRVNDNSQISSNRPPEIAPQNNPGVKCSENSPERRGEEGCTILANRPLAASLAKPLYWHIDGFERIEAAQKAAGADGVAFEAHNAIWLSTIEAQTKDHHGGRHIAMIGPLPIPKADKYTMRVQSSLLKPGSTTPVHTHSGLEGVYVVDGEQCMETAEVGHRLTANQSLIIPPDTTHRGRVMGNSVRRAFGIIIYDPTQPASHDLTDVPPIALCK